MGLHFLKISINFKMVKDAGGFRMNR